ncbi:MAG: hypothetical protein QXG00_01580 [Candidatus Woesearchaeota archaeon]
MKKVFNILLIILLTINAIGCSTKIIENTNNIADIQTSEKIHNTEKINSTTEANNIFNNENNIQPPSLPE